jgi:hypothetical protein
MPYVIADTLLKVTLSRIQTGHHDNMETNFIDA